MRLSARSSRKTGHCRKILSVLDNSEECERAVNYAAAQAKSTKSTLKLLYIIDDSDFKQMFGVEHVMRAEATEHANELMARIVETVKKHYKIQVEDLICEGQSIDKIIDVVDKDSDIALLVLAAGTSQDETGSLMHKLLGADNNFALPITVVPNTITDAVIDEIA